MSERRIVEYICDSCNAATHNAGLVHWFVLTRPQGAPVRHFCSAVCLNEWAVNTKDYCH